MKKDEYRVLGIMSGTSLDGIDVAQLRFSKDNTWSYEILAAETIAYPRQWKEDLAEAVSFSDAKLEDLNGRYTQYLAEVVSRFIAAHKITDLDAVCSHGHTIKHEPESGYTLQIGNLPQLAHLIGQRVVCDFRVQDVELGGQGAPLVPIGDELLFAEYDFCLNLGGFANVSTNKKAERIAYDICPVNTVMNFLSQKLGLPYDKDGDIAASGELDEALLDQLNTLDFYSQAPPKSLGIEWVNAHILPLLEAKTDIPSALHTYTLHAAIQIAGNLEGTHASKVLATGGGAFNRFLIGEIQSRTSSEVVIPSPELVNYKEALIFGFLGILKLRGEINTLSSVTGARRDHSAGMVFGE